VSETAAAAPRRSSRVLLLVSLALNLFFIGAAVALAWRHYAWDRREAWTPGARVERLAASLPSADADKLRAAFRTHMPAIEQARAAYRAAHERLRESLRAEPYNADAVRAAMADIRAARAKLDEALQDTILSASAQMGPDSRRALADWTPSRRRGKEKDR
jgi:uncharacterized membrane protein